MPRTQHILGAFLAAGAICFFVASGVAHAQEYLGTGLTVTADVVASGSEVASSPVPTPNPVTEGGGGGGAISERATVHFSGAAYPGATVTVTRDGVDARTTTADAAGSFAISFADLHPGTSVFSTYATDTSGRVSATASFPILVGTGVDVTVTGLTLSPTLAVSGTDGAVTFVGSSVPGSTVVIALAADPEERYVVQAGSDGAYAYTLPAGSVASGTYAAAAKTVLPAIETSYGRSMLVTIGATVAPSACSAIVGDLNCDGRVDETDFSILQYWYGRANPPASVDLNHDGAVTLADFSILAHDWTF